MPTSELYCLWSHTQSSPDEKKKRKIKHLLENKINHKYRHARIIFYLNRMGRYANVMHVVLKHASNVWQFVFQHVSSLYWSFLMSLPKTLNKLNMKRQHFISVHHRAGTNFQKILDLATNFHLKILVLLFAL